MTGALDLRESRPPPWRALAQLVLLHAVRRLLKGPARAVLLCGAVALGVAVFIAVLYASDASVRSFERSIAPLLGESGGEIRSRAGSFRGADIAALARGLSQGLDLLPVWETTGRIGDRAVKLLAVDPIGFAARYGPLSPLDDTVSTPRGFASEQLQRELAPSPASGVGVSTPHGAISLYLEPPPERLADALPVDTIVLSLDAVAPIRPEDIFTGVKVWTRAGEARPEYALAELASVLKHHTPAGFFLGDVRRRAEHAERLFSAFRLNIGVLVLMTLVVCAFTVFGAAQLSVIALQRELGVMRTLGCGRVTLAAVILSEAAVIGALGALIGATLGRPLTEGCARLFLRTVAVLYGGSEPPRALWGGDIIVMLPLVLVLGVALAVGGALVPAWRASRIPPGIVGRAGVAAVPVVSSYTFPLIGATIIGATLALVTSASFDSALSAHAAAFFLIGCILISALPVLLAAARYLKPRLARLAGVPGLIGSAHLTAGARISALAVGAGGTGLALLVGLGLMVSSFRSTLEEWIGHTIRADIFLRPIESGTFDQPARLSSTIETRLASIAGVQAVSRFAATEVELDTGTSLTVAGTDFLTGPGVREYTLIAGVLDPSELATSPGVLLSESASRKLGLGVDDELVAAGQRLIVRGVFRDYTTEHGLALLDFAQFRRRFGPIGLTSAALYLNADASLEAALNDLTAGPDGETLLVQRNRGLREAILGIFDETFRITELMRAIVVLITAVGFILTLLQLHAERRADTTTLRVLGADRAMLRRAVFFEGAIMLAPSLALGLAGGTALALILIYLVNPLSFGWTLTFVPTVADYLLPVGVVVLSAIGGALIVALSLSTKLEETNRDD